MPLFKCKVINKEGKNQYVFKDASDEVALNAKLKREGLVLLSSSIVKEKEPNVFFSVSSKVKRKEVVMFLRQFSVLINASVSISDSLATLKVQNYTPVFKKVVMELHRDVQSGLLLSEAFAKHKKVFPRFFTEMVAIGEVSGSLDTVLKDMATYYENDSKIKGKALSAMSYPTLLFVMINLVIIFMSYVILPKFEGMFKDFGGQIPKFTEIVLTVASFIRDYIVFILVGIAALILLLVVFFNTKEGKKFKDFLALKTPIIGKITYAIITSRFTKAFVILLRSGMNITDSLENLKRILDNHLFASKFEYAILEVKRGKPIAKSIENTGMFPGILTEMIAVGEKSGNLEEVLDSTSSFYDDEVERSISRAVKALEPIMIVFLGAVVAAVLLSVYVPMISLMDTI